MTGDKEAMTEALVEFQKRRRSGYALAVNIFAQCISKIVFAKDSKYDFSFQGILLTLSGLNGQICLNDFAYLTTN